MRDLVRAADTLIEPNRVDLPALPPSVSSAIMIGRQSSLQFVGCKRDLILATRKFCGTPQTNDRESPKKGYIQGDSAGKRNVIKLV